MESLFTEAESATNLRRSSFCSSTLTNNYYRNFYWGLGFKSSSQNAYNYSLHPSNTMAGASFRGEIGYLPAPAAPTPTPTPTPTPLRQQPPLLPLPMKSATKKISVPPSAISRSSSTAARQNNQIKRKKKQQQRQSKPSTNPKKEPAAELEAAKIEGAPKPMENKPTIFVAKKEEEEEEEETGEEFLIGAPAASKSVSSVYSLSPPPSSLPLPRLLLMRPRRSAKVAPVASSCNIAEAVAGADAGAADDLRKLLRL